MFLEIFSIRFRTFSFVFAFLVVLSSACKKDDSRPPSVPELGPTVPVSNILESSAISGGKILYDGGSPITARGVCFGTQPNPTVNSGLPNSGTTVDGTGSGSFSSTLTGLVPSTLYYVRSYAVNALGTGYGPEITFVSNFAPPLLTTGAVSKLGLVGNSVGYQATISVTLSNLNGGKVVRKGLLWSVYSPNPTLEDQEGLEFDTVSVGPGNYSFTIKDIPRGKEVYLRPFVTARMGSRESIGYGNSVAVETFVKDIDNNRYNFATIGNQTWLTENLRVKQLNDGSAAIPISESSNQWVTGNNEQKMICDYPGEQAMNEAKYGLLYNFKTVESGKVCPQGWHVPSLTEAQVLTTSIGGTLGNARKLQSTEWDSGTETGTNSSGFKGLPAGYVSVSGWPTSFRGNVAQIHTSTAATTNDSRVLLLDYSQDIRFPAYSKKEGSSIRCVKD